MPRISFFPRECCIVSFEWKLPGIWEINNSDRADKPETKQDVIDFCEKTAMDNIINS